jgi:hypothetical protein
MVCRHEALRTRVVVVDGAPVQKIHPPRGSEDLQVEDLSSLPEHIRQAGVTRKIEECMTHPIDVACDSLFAAWILKLRDDEHVLILATEHLISDAVSLSILRQELLTVYFQLLRGESPRLPPIGMQLADYAIWQRTVCSAWMERHGQSLNKRLAGCHRLRFPDDTAAMRAGGRSGWAGVPIRINSDLTRRLRDWSRARSTTVSMTVLTAYAAFVLRWCGVSDCVIQYQSDGRLSDQIANTIGYFASVLYLRLSLLPGDCFLHLLVQVASEYGAALEHASLTHLALRQPPPGFVRNPIFNWLPREHIAAVPDSRDQAQPLACEPMPTGIPGLEKLDWDHEPGIQLWEYDSEIVGHLFFPRSRFDEQSMERLSSHLLQLVRMLLQAPADSVPEIEPR